MADENKKTGPLPAKGLESGMKCWAYGWNWPKGIPAPLYEQKPVQGVLAEHYNQIGDPSHEPGWFVPCSGKSRRPAFMDAVLLQKTPSRAARKKSNRWKSSCSVRLIGGTI